MADGLHGTAAAIVLVGPGAFSVDAALFGRREIAFRGRSGGGTDVGPVAMAGYGQMSLRGMARNPLCCRRRRSVAGATIAAI